MIKFPTFSAPELFTCVCSQKHLTAARCILPELGQYFSWICKFIAKYAQFTTTGQGSAHVLYGVVDVPQSEYQCLSYVRWNRHVLYPLHGITWLMKCSWYSEMRIRNAKDCTFDVPAYQTARGSVVATSTNSTHLKHGEAAHRECDSRQEKAFDSRRVR